VFCAGAGNHVAKLILDVVSEVRSVGNVDAASGRNDLKWSSFRGLRLFLCDLARVSHRIQNLIATCRCCFDLCVRIITIGTANQAREKCRLGQGEIGNVLVEIRAGRFSKSIDREPSLLAHVDLIAVKLKDLLFVEPSLQNDRHVGFADFALPRLFRRQQ
jgi:hypothetical protein